MRCTIYVMGGGGVPLGIQLVDALVYKPDKYRNFLFTSFTPFSFVHVLSLQPCIYTDLYNLMLIFHPLGNVRNPSSLNVLKFK
jgi:hypothetical protein